MYKIALLIPYMRDEFLKRELANKEYIGTQYLAANLIKYGYPCELINGLSLKITNEELCKKVLEAKYDFVGISLQTQKEYSNFRDFIYALRNNGYLGHICVGGFFASLAYKEIMSELPSEINTMILGEGEDTIVRLISALSSGNDYKDIKGIAFMQDNKLSYSYSDRILNLDDLPYPIRNRDYIGGEINVFDSDSKIINGYFRLIAGRGCYGNCSFCTCIKFYQPPHKIYRSPSNVVGEIEELVNKYGINQFMFDDETFYINNKHGREWVIEFTDKLKERSLKINFEIELRANDIADEPIALLKEAGLKKVSFGAESGVQRILDEMNKKCTTKDFYNAVEVLKRYEIDFVYGFITIVPTMTFDEICETYEFLFNIGSFREENLYNVLNVYYGSDYVKILENYNLLITSDFSERHNYLYIDKKTEIFAEVIVETRKYFIPYRERLFLLRNDEIIALYPIYTELCKEIWVGIVKNLINLINECDENLISYSKISDLNLDYFNISKKRIIDLFEKNKTLIAT